MGILSVSGSTDVTSTLLWTADETLEEFIVRCWESRAAGCHQVLWHMFEKGFVDLERFWELNGHIERGL
eukprot:1989179-Alexandrium_andersonii.AAC.1